MIRHATQRACFGVWRTLVLALVLVLWAAPALAETAPETDDAAPETDTDDPAASPPAPSSDEPDSPSDAPLRPGVRSTPPGFRVPFFTLSPRVGYAFLTKANLTPDFTVAERHALVATLGFDIGGEGLVMTVSPVYLYEHGTGILGDFHSVGGYIGMDFRWRWWNFVPSAGVGFRGSYLIGDAISHGIELVGRFPLALTWYITPRVSLIFELGLGYGATGIQAASVDLPRLQMGHGIVVDALVGTRFP